MTTVAEAIARSISHTEIATIETAGVATIVEELRDAAARADLEVIVNDENDGAKGVVAFRPGTPEGESVWRVRVSFEPYAEVEPDSAVGPRVLFTLASSDAAEEKAGEAGYFVGFADQVQTSLVVDGEPVYSAPCLRISE